MSPIAAFASGSGLSVDQVKFLVAGVISATALLWGAWSATSLWRGWAGNRVKQEIFTYALVRIVLMVVLIIWIVT